MLSSVTENRCDSTLESLRVITWHGERSVCPAVQRRVTRIKSTTSEVYASRQVVAQRGRPNIMIHSWRVVVFTLSTLSLAATDQAWKGKQFSEWTEDDAKEVMTDSPWAKTVTPTQATSPDQDTRTASGGSRHREGDWRWRYWYRTPRHGRHRPKRQSTRRAIE